MTTTRKAQAVRNALAMPDVEVIGFQHAGQVLFNVFIPTTDDRRKLAMSRLKAAGYRINVKDAAFLGIEKR